MIPKKILYCTDFSKNSRTAGNYAVEYAKVFEAALMVLHVIESWEGFPTSQDRLKADIDRLIRSSEKLANAELTEWSDQVIQGVERVSTHVRMGIPAREIVLLANEQAVGLIVMGTRGRTGLKHILLGSVAENVIKTAQSPVLVVRSVLTTSKVVEKTQN